jgi:Glycosyltransferase like family 2
VVQACPSRLILVTPYNQSESLTRLAHSIDSAIEVLDTEYANKRVQIARALPMVTTRFTVLADDDIIWPSNHFLDYLLAIFENDKTGAGGTFQEVKRTDWSNIWQYLSAGYIRRRNFEISATTYMDGSISCLSGRTQIIRTSIIRGEDFIESYTNERFNGRLLNTDDDNFITRWLFSHGWDIRIQSSPEAMVSTTLEANSKFLQQCLRWSRSTWRSNYKIMTAEQRVLRYVPSHPIT